MYKVAYFTNIAPHYRNRLWLMLAKDESFDFHFYFGRSPENSIREVDFTAPEWQLCQQNLHTIKNFRYRHVLYWQRGVITAILRQRHDILLFTGDMYVISTWLAAAVAWFRRIPVVFWGHGYYGSEKGATRLFRKLFNRLPKRHLLYGHYARSHMAQHGIAAERLRVVYNSLDYDQHKKLRDQVVDPAFYPARGYFRDPSLPLLIFIGRLTREKRLDLLLDAVISINASGSRVNLVIVGDGVEKACLEERAGARRECIYFYGPCYDEPEIGCLLANADLCVSPGMIGLTAIHSLSFGTPCCTHGNLSFQMPEAEAIIEGENGTLFNLEAMDLQDVIIKWLAHTDREKVRDACYRRVDECYNPYYQVNVFKQVISEIS
jgi:glycosyltransferase involved in cell wall biosynthesis